MKPPLRYYGGKTYQAAWILDVIKRYEFKTYIEPFGGSGAILFAKEPSPVEIYNDIYSDLVTIYRVLSTPKMYKEFVMFIENSPYSRELFGESKNALSHGRLSSAERAGHFFITIRQSYSGLRTNWSSAGKCGKPKATPYRHAIDRLPEVHERLRNVHIEHKDAVRLKQSRQDQWRDDALLTMFWKRPWSFDRPPYLRGKLARRVNSPAKQLPEQRRTQIRLLNRGSPSR
jgi:DNA adenine methylase